MVLVISLCIEYVYATQLTFTLENKVESKVKYSVFQPNIKTNKNFEAMK